MNRWQKIAWFNLIVMLGGFASSFIAAATLPPAERFMPPNRLTLVIIVTLVLVVASNIIFRKKPKQVDFDERDRQIRKRAKYAGWIAFALTMLIVTMILYFAVGPEGTFSPLVLPLIPAAGGGICVMAGSVATLIQYGRGGKEK